MAKKLKIPGAEASAQVQTAKVAELTQAQQPLLDIQLQKIVDVSSARETAAAVMVALEPRAQDVSGQICEVEFEGGVKLWMRATSFYREFGAAPSRGAAPSADDDVWAIAPSLSKPPAARGGESKIAIRRVTVYKWQRAVPRSVRRNRGVAIDWLKDAAVEGAGGVVTDFVADRIAGSVGRFAEKHQLGGADPGLYRLNLNGEFLAEKVATFEGDGPHLVFIHGTLSSCKGSFENLWKPTNSAGVEARKQLAASYGAAYAWQHYTLTESPIDNALALARVLPANATLHLLTHSRGGLVGDLLCLGQYESCAQKSAVSPFAGNEAQAIALAALIALLQEKQIEVERYVRVACPARGTTLASNRLDRWLSIFKLLGDLVSPLKLPLNLLLALIAEHEDASNLPGLEAMMPGSPLIRTLNMPQLKVRADLSVIAGDTQGTGLLGRLKEFALDRFFEDESDLIVNTGAMYGGLTRTEDARFFLDRGPGVNHFNYFENAQTVRMIAAGLLRADGSQGGFDSIKLAKEKEPARAALRREVQGPRPAVFLLPGIMGTHLNVNGARVWLDKGELMFGGLGKLKMNGVAVTADPFLEDYYNALAEHLGETHEVIRFPYDWRHSIVDAGDKLARKITEKLDELEPTGQPVRILAHSMGGLVARAMIAQHEKVWRRMIAHEGGRLVMLGTPNGGSHEIVRLLTGRATTLHALALLDFAHGASRLLKIIRGFPGVLELLPIADDFAFFTPQLWAKLKKNDQDTRFSWEPPDASDLSRARLARKAVEKIALDPERVLYVAGCANATPNGWRIETQFDYDGIRGHWSSIAFEATRQGDGQVPWATGIPLGIKNWYLDEVVHGDLPSHAPAFSAYVELLETGSTTKLAATPPATARTAAADRVFDMPMEFPASLPGQRDLAASVMGAKPARHTRAESELPKARVSITHGDLAYAKHPVAVGHYRGDTIVSAEDYLDRVLGGRLRDRNRLGLYPGDIGTCEVFLNPDKFGKPGGAIVIGLGQVGELSPGTLTQAVARAALAYALQVAECPDDRFGGAAARSARITSLLIGTGAGGMTVRDSIESILRGIASANRRLDEIGFSGKVSIDAVEFIEIWQDVAIHGARELERALTDSELSRLFEWRERCIGDGEGGRRRVLFEEAPNWWHRVEIVYDPMRDELRFITLTDRARAEETLVAGQRRIADDFIRQAIAETSHDSDISRTLFEILVPNRMKQFAPDREDVVLVVDEVSGSYPWELLEDRWSGGEKPVAVASGMLRQLKSIAFRERPAIPFQDTAYVVGNPALPPARDDFPFEELAGAESEAVAVADFLQANGFKVKRQIHTPARAVLADLHADGYRVLHLAGHGVHDWKVAKSSSDLPEKTISGMLLGDGVFLTPGDIEQMRWVPELVFMNCCHLGSLDRRLPTPYSQLAANLAAQFIRMGVKAVIAAGWAVDDAAAETFAVSLYTHLLDENPFGDAVRAARAETFDRHANTNTWGAYQCYGDPAYRLRLKPGAQSRKKPRDYVTPAQVVVELENLAACARTSGGAIEDAEKIAQAMIEQRRQEWLDRPDVCEALGLAYGELGAFEQAIAYLDRALSAEQSEGSLRTIEQRANFRTRLAAKLDDPATRERHIKTAIAELNGLLKWGETAERLCLLGSAYKRQAQLAVRRKDAKNERDQALRAMEKYYREAHGKGLSDGRLAVYPLLNWLSAKILLNRKLDAAALADIDQWCEKAQAQAAEKDDPDFWTGIVMPDCDLMRAFARQTLPQQKQIILDGYRRAMKRGASEREVGSVLEHIEFVIAIAESLRGDRNRRKQVSVLREIKNGLAEAKQ